MNIIMLMPSSAIGAIVSGRFSVMAPSSGKRSASMRKAERAHRDADQHEPQHRAEPQPVKQRDHDGGSGQDDQGRLEQRRVEVRAQVSVPERGQEAVERLRHQARRLDAGEMP